MKYLKSKLKTFSIRKQLLLIYLPFALLFTLVTSIFIIYDSSKLLVEKYEELVLKNSQLIKSSLLNTTNLASNVAEYLATDNQLHDILTTEVNDSSQFYTMVNQYSYLNRLKQQEPAIASIKIYSTNPNIKLYGAFQFADQTIQTSPIFQKTLTHSDNLWTTTQTESLNKLSLYKKVPLPLSNYQAVIKIDIDYNYLKNKLQSRNYLTDIVLNSQPIFFSSDIQHLNTVTQLAKNDESMSQGIYFKKNEHKTLLISKQVLTLTNSTDKVFTYTADQSAYSNIRANIIKWLGILIILLLMTVTIIMLFTNYFYQRIKKLQDAVYHVAIEDYAFFNAISGEDEISKISLDFHTITQHIKAKEEQIYQSELIEKNLLTQQQQMEFHLLVSQINPHFLFNTLESIRMTALKGGNKDVAQSIKLLAKSMRFTLDYQGKKITTLKEELDIAQGYIKIQQMRFGDRVTFDLFIDEKLNIEEVATLPLIIQPLVENAIVHGLESKESNGMIWMTILKKEEDLWIEIKDNGIGISSENLKKIQSTLADFSNKSTRHIGLRNIHQRLLIFYGDDYGLTIQSIPNKGTTIQMKIACLQKNLA